MIILISPAKTMDLKMDIPIMDYTIPSFMKESEALMRELKKMDVGSIKELMKISQTLAMLNFERFQSWDPNFNPENARQALFVFKGEVYNGLKAWEFSKDNVRYAQDHLRILSGLYGVLKPLDLVKPYRLEMGTNLKTAKANNLFEFWGGKITQSLNSEMKSLKEKIIVNLASKEYFKSINQKALTSKIITPEFLDYNGGKYRFVTFFAKNARGLMASYIIRNRIEDPEEIKLFDEAGYYYSEERSTNDRFVFTRN